MQIYKNCQIREELEKGYRWITLSQQINVGDTQDGYIYIHIYIYIWCVYIHTHTHQNHNQKWLSNAILNYDTLNVPIFMA